MNRLFSTLSRYSAIATLSLTAVASLLTMVAPARAQTVPKMSNGYSVDNCLHWGTECGKPAADEFCRRTGVPSGAATFTMAAMHPTWVLGDSKVCDQTNCVGFTSIYCSAGGAAPPPGGGRVLDVSGYWYGRNGAWVYQFAQNGNNFTWSRNPPEQASGSLSGSAMTANWGTGSGNARITESNGNTATRIQWDNGEVFVRSAGRVLDVSGYWYGRNGAWVYQFAQNGNNFAWSRNPPERASGSITGSAMFANWGTGSGWGEITNANGNFATRLQWVNGEVFVRSAGNGGGGGGNPPSSSGTMSLSIDATRPPYSVMSPALQTGVRYVVEVAGTFSYWPSDELKDSPEGGVDPLWCYAKWRCPTPQKWQSLLMNGKGLADFSGQPLPYNPQHSYRIEVIGAGSPVNFGLSEPHGGMIGGMNIRIYPR